jgi:hypothetical protein
VALAGEISAAASEPEKLESAAPERATATGRRPAGIGLLPLPAALVPAEAGAAEAAGSGPAWWMSTLSTVCSVRACDRDSGGGGEVTASGVAGCDEDESDECVCVCA